MSENYMEGNYKCKCGDSHEVGTICMRPIKDQPSETDGELKPISKVELLKAVTDWHKNACKIPPYWGNIIEEITGVYMKALSISLGNLELCIRRTLDHTDEVRKDMPK